MLTNLANLELGKMKWFKQLKNKIIQEYTLNAEITYWISGSRSILKISLCDYYRRNETKDTVELRQLLYKVYSIKNLLVAKACFLC